MNRTARWFKKYCQFEYWDSLNSTICTHCSNKKHALAIIKASGIEQRLEVC